MQPMNKAVKPDFADVACLTVALHRLPPFSFVDRYSKDRRLKQMSFYNFYSRLNSTWHRDIAEQCPLTGKPSTSFWFWNIQLRWELITEFLS